MEWCLNWQYHAHIGMTLGFSPVMPAMLMGKTRWLFSSLFRVRFVSLFCQLTLEYEAVFGLVAAVGLVVKEELLSLVGNDCQFFSPYPVTCVLVDS
jgi:hypothetical protein